MVPTVLSLPQVLHEAQRHGVVEIAIEPGEPVTFHGDQGVLVLGDALEEAAISEALTDMLGPDQQAELAVASVVEFHVPGFDEWMFVAETSAEGVVIRGRIRDGRPTIEYGSPMELPPLAPFEYERSAEIPRPSPLLRQPEPRETRWDVGIISSNPVGAREVPEPGAVQEVVPPVPTGAIEDPTLAPSILQGRPLAAPEHAASLDDLEGLIDFALVGRGAPTANVPEASTVNARRGSGTTRTMVSGPGAPVPSSPIARAPSGTNGRAPSSSGVSPESSSARRPSSGPGMRPTMRGDDTLAMHVDALAPSTVVHLAAIGAGERLLAHHEAGFELVDEATWARVITRPLDQIPMGQAYLVRMEDPSRCLAWLLRRVEEGSCLVVETRSRTAAGARRTLLGDAGTLHLARWLDAHRHLWLYPDGVAWVLESA